MDNMLTVPDFFQKFLTLQAVACDEENNEKMQLEIQLGMPVCCYPCGTRICLEIGPRESSCEEEFIIKSSKLSGSYMLHKVNDEGSDPISTSLSLQGYQAHLILKGPFACRIHGNLYIYIHI